jgi:hypothetical protein
MVPSSYCLSPFFFFSPPLLLPHRLHISIDALAIGGWNPPAPRWIRPCVWDMHKLEYRNLHT